MSYFDYYCKNIKQGQEVSKDHIQGSCYTMCPQAEIQLREKEKMVHVLEMFDGTKQLVKSYSRSAADLNMAVPRLLRPYSVLKKTLQHLLSRVLLRQDVPTAVIYDFVNDRLRAIRQDITIQRLPPEECAGLLEPMIRFYVYFGYRLSELPITDFDPVLNEKHLLECMKWFLYCCNIIQPQSQHDVNTKLLKLDISDANNGYNRVLVESLYILCNLDDLHPLLRYLTLPKELKCKKPLQTAYEIGLAKLKGNYISIFKLVDSLCPLTYYAVWLYLSDLQRYALKVMSHAYSSKQLMVPIQVVMEWLHFDNEGETIRSCKHYGLTAKEDGIKFNKADFNNAVALHQKKINNNNERDKNLQYIFNYNTE